MKSTIKNSMKRLGTILLALSITVSIAPIWSYAIPVPDPDRFGSVTVTMQDQKTGKLVSGGTMTLLRAGDVNEDDGNFSFMLTEEFKESKESLEEPDAELAQRLAAYAKERDIDGKTAAVGSDGKACFEALEPGLYLLVQQQAAKGYYEVSPFVVTIPLLEGEGYIYDVDATPKMELLGKKPDTQKPSSGQPQADAPDGAAKTGDSSNIALWGLTMLAALSGGILVVIASGRKQEKRKRNG